MPKPRKSAAPAQANPLASEDTPSSKSKKVSPPVSSKMVTASVVVPVNNVVVAPTTSDEVVPESVDSAIIESFGEFMSKLQTLCIQMNALKAEFRTLEKKALRELKTAQRNAAKRRRKSVNRQPSGFVKPTLISDELATFLKKPSGTEMARTEVTREINGYIRAHSLQDKQNGRKINPDSELAKLLKIGDGEELTYFNLQRYMSPHFAKATPKIPGVASTVIAPAANSN